jgi:sec-independent protein translocase protein TatC
VTLEEAFTWLLQPAPFTQYPWAAVLGLVLGLVVIVAGFAFVGVPRFRVWWLDETPRPNEDERGVSTEELTLMGHLLELRTRLMWAVGTLIVTTIIAFPFFRFWFYIAVRPLLGKGNCPADLAVGTDATTGAYSTCLQAISPTELIFAYFKVTLVVGLGLAIPMIAYQAWAYIAPGLTRQERKYVILLVPGATILFVIGVLFAYFALMPPALGFLLGFTDPLVAVIPTVDSYISFITRLLIAIGVIFELPLAMGFLAKVRIINPKMLNGIRRYVVVVAFIIAAIVTPTPDPFNQLLVAIPILVLYEVGALITRFV